ncbi:MAG: zf-HC2 domain-containing protein [Methylocystaceae bacterium]
MINECPEIGKIQAYADRELQPDEYQKIEGHLLSCPVCRQISTDIVHENEWLSGLFTCENQTLSLSANKLSRWFNEELGIRFWWVLSGFLLLGLTAVLLGSYSLQEIAVSLGWPGSNPHLLIDALRQRLVSDGWHLLITWGVSRATSINLLPTSWQLFLLIMGIVIIRSLSVRLSRIKEVIF